MKPCFSGFFTPGNLDSCFVFARETSLSAIRVTESQATTESFTDCVTKRKTASQNAKLNRIVSQTASQNGRQHHRKPGYAGLFHRLRHKTENCVTESQAKPDSFTDCVTKRKTESQKARLRRIVSQTASQNGRERHKTPSFTR